MTISLASEQVRTLPWPYPNSPTDTLVLLVLQQEERTPLGMGMKKPRGVAQSDALKPTAISLLKGGGNAKAYVPSSPLLLPSLALRTDLSRPASSAP